MEIVMPKWKSKTILKILMKFASLVVQKISVSLITVSVKKNIQRQLHQPWSRFFPRQNHRAHRPQRRRNLHRHVMTSKWWSYIRTWLGCWIGVYSSVRSAPVPLPIVSVRLILKDHQLFTLHLVYICYVHYICIMCVSSLGFTMRFFILYHAIIEFIEIISRAVHAVSYTHLTLPTICSV